MNEDGEQPIKREELLGWIECGCWIALALVPLLYWVNGPAVSQDQLVVRGIVVAGAAVGAVMLCWRRRGSQPVD